jgi:hypothetical protein
VASRFFGLYAARLIPRTMGSERRIVAYLRVFEGSDERRPRQLGRPEAQGPAPSSWGDARPARPATDVGQ